MPVSLRQAHQLAIVCSIRPEDRIRLERLARQHGLSPDELILTGFVPEEDLVALYNLCKVFVFPSWHEGFGLPALEAMACGRAVIAANTSSLPEVVGCDEALFDPLDDESIARKLEQVLTDEDFRKALEQHGIEQAKSFSWDKSAMLAIRALEVRVARHEEQGSLSNRPLRRPRLAYVSPLPPERSGISDYSAELLPELARHYDIDVIVAQGSVETPWIRANCAIRSVEWFRSHAGEYDRVLYHLEIPPSISTCFHYWKRFPVLSCCMIFSFPGSSGTWNGRRVDRTSRRRCMQAMAILRCITVSMQRMRRMRSGVILVTSECWSKPKASLCTRKTRGGWGSNGTAAKRAETGC
ncbi:glycosyltransferase [Azotobacter sp. CWF10]